jgi:hypothetical protein
MRRFARASSERIYIGSAGPADFRWGTIACVFNAVTLVAAGTLLATNDATAASTDLYLSSDPPNDTIHLYDGTNDAAGPAINAGTTYLVGMSKTSGTVAPRFHVYSEAGGWVHADGSVACVDAGLTTSVGIGSYANAAAQDAYDGDIGAIATWPSWAMSDQEFERLLKGNWASRSPSLLFEFFTAQDSVNDAPHNLGRARIQQTARTGTSLGTTPRLAGFRPSLQSRRR